MIIGEGGFAQVVVDENDSSIAIKKLLDKYHSNTEFLHRFKREYEILKSLQDIAGIIPVYEFNEQLKFYTMKRCDKNLKEFLDTENITESFSEYLIDSILSIMEQVHERNIIHRDLSVTNVLINDTTDGYEVYISDFGLGKFISKDVSFKTQTIFGMGQLSYTSPEQINGFKEATQASDVYSIGKTINYILTKSPNDINHKYRGVCDKATADLPEARYRNAKEMKESIQKHREISIDEELKNKVRIKLNARTYDESVEEYLQMLSPTELAEECRKSSYVVDGLIWTIKKNHQTYPKSTLETIELLGKNCKKFRAFSDADNFAYFAEEILKDNSAQYSYSIRYSAAGILNWAAFYVGRFAAQNRIERLIKDGIDPTLEDKLNEKSFTS